MMFFDCNKVGIHLDLQTTQFIPGDMIRGIFHLNVMRDLEITALRVCVKGKEKAWRWEEDRPQGGPQQGGGPRESNYRLYEERFVHFMRIITVFGQSRQSGAKGRVYLRPGQYQYPFEVELPPNAPPSYLFSSRQVGSRIYYTIKAYVDIPFGFDAKQKLHLSVLPAVPIGQLMEARASPYIFPTTQSTIHGCEYCGCFYCEHEDSLIETSGALLPRVAILRCGSGVPMHAMPPPPQVTQVFLSKNAPAGIDQTTGNTVANPSGVAMRLDQNPAVITVHGTIRNCSRKDDIRSVRVELKQFQQLRVRGNSTSRVVTLAATTFTPPNGQLAPCQSMDVDVELRLDTHQIDTGMLACSHREYMRRFSRNYRGFGHSENYFPQRDICFDSSNSTVIFPTITTPFVECTTLFQISFPGTAVKDTLSRSDLVTIAAGVDPSNRVPASPFRYSNQLVLPEICYGGM